MYRLLTLSFILCFLHFGLESQVLPKEGAALNYRLVGFSVVEKINKGQLQIAMGNFESEDSFTENIIKTISIDSNKIITEVPFWGCRYTWRLISSDNSNTAKTPLYHFYTSLVPEIDTSIVRLRIIDSAKKYVDAYVLLDSKRVMYDMKGKPVWFMPNKVYKDYISQHVNLEPRDLKLSCKSTITYLMNGQAYEINYNGDILWKGPNTGEVVGDNTERYHHELTRLCSGHYVVLGEEKDVLWPPGNKYRSHATFGTIIEYDEKGHVVWSWKTSAYLPKSDLIYYHTGTDTTFKSPSVHENSFYFDEENKFIYLGCRDISRILKIKYPEGNVLSTYGETFKPGYTTEASKGLFCNQHSIHRSKNGYLYVFNNNVCKPGAPPEVLVLKEYNHNKNKLKKIWEYQCEFGQDFSKIDKTVGGNVIDLPDASIFVSMGGEYPRIFIVSMDKELIWSAVQEIWNIYKKKWEVCEQYRASIIVQREDLEKLIWNQ